MLLKKYLWQPGCLASTKKKSIRLLLYYSLHPSAYMLTLWAAYRESSAASALRGRGGSKKF